MLWLFSVRRNKDGNFQGWWFFQYYKGILQHSQKIVFCAFFNGFNLASHEAAVEVIEPGLGYSFVFRIEGVLA